MIKETFEFIKTICSMCGRDISHCRPRGRFIVCPKCTISVPIGANSYQKLKGGDKNMPEQKVKAKTAVKPVIKKKVKEDGEEKTRKKYGDDVEKKVIALYKSGTTKFTEISKELGGHPAVPYIKRLLKREKLIE